jgi:RNA 3'-terminal phosphate cyclase-like protein
MIKVIRSEATNPGLLLYEVNFLQLLEKLTNGSTSVISKTGTKITFRPGITDCADGLLAEHERFLEQSITFRAVPARILAIFG